MKREGNSKSMTKAAKEKAQRTVGIGTVQRPERDAESIVKEEEKR